MQHSCWGAHTRPFPCEDVPWETRIGWRPRISPRPVSSPSTPPFGCWRGVLRAMHAAVTRELDPLGLTAAHALPLAKLSSGGAYTSSRLARECGLGAGTMTRTLDRLAAKGLVVRSHSHADRRRVSLELTPAGRDAGSRRAHARGKRVPARIHCARVPPLARHALAHGATQIDSARALQLEHLGEARVPTFQRLVQLIAAGAQHAGRLAEDRVGQRV